MSEVTLYHGDCLLEMSKIPDCSVDMILTDPPYGTISCDWDIVIPFEPMWQHLKRIVKPKGAIVLCANQPFTTDLIQSNRKQFKYIWTWNKCLAGGFLNANRQPLKVTEDIVVFGEGALHYYPQMTKGRFCKKGTTGHEGGDGISTMGSVERTKSYNNTYYPTNLIEFTKGDRNNNKNGSLHKTQKPLVLMSYLIQTYTLPGETVLDFTMGSGTTLCAAINTGRNAIGIELDDKYFAVAEKRIKAAMSQQMLAL